MFSGRRSRFLAGPLLLVWTAVLCLISIHLALDALLRRAVSRISAALLMVLIFIVLREVFRWLGTNGSVGGGLAATFVALAAPTIWARTREYLDAKLYPRIDPSISSQHLYELGTEVALWRPPAADEMDYRREIAQLNQDLAAAPLLAVASEKLAEHTLRLLHADEVLVWACQRNGSKPLLARAGTGVFRTLDEAALDINSLLGSNLTQLLNERHVVRVAETELGETPLADDRHLLAFSSDGDCCENVIAVAARLSGSQPFTVIDELRASEIAKQVQAWLRSESAVEFAPVESRAELTPREIEIAVLIARGLTNRQIALQLSIAEKTVGKHIEHIMAKLGFHSRAQVAVWTVEHSLSAPPHPLSERSN